MNVEIIFNCKEGQPTVKLTGYKSTNILIQTSDDSGANWSHGALIDINDLKLALRKLSAR